MRFEELGQVVSERLREHDASGARRTLDAPYGSRHSTGSVCLTSILVGTILGLLVAWNIIRDTRSQPSWENLELVVPWVNLGVIFLVVYAVALAATLAPAIRASRIRPAEALRYQ